MLAKYLKIWANYLNIREKRRPTVFDSEKLARNMCRIT